MFHGFCDSRLRKGGRAEKGREAQRTEVWVPFEKQLPVLEKKKNAVRFFAHGVLMWYLIGVEMHPTIMARKFCPMRWFFKRKKALES